MTLYDVLRAAGAALDNHYSDLYVQATPEARAIVRRFAPAGVTTFTSPDGETWLDVPFAYAPYWQAKVSK